MACADAKENRSVPGTDCSVAISPRWKREDGGILQIRWSWRASPASSRTRSMSSLLPKGFAARARRRAGEPPRRHRRPGLEVARDRHDRRGREARSQCGDCLDRAALRRVQVDDDDPCRQRFIEKPQALRAALDDAVSRVAQRQRDQFAHERIVFDDENVCPAFHGSVTAFNVVASVRAGLPRYYCIGDIRPVERHVTVSATRPKVTNETNRLFHL